MRDHKDQNTWEQTDPVCGMRVDSRNTEQSTFQGQTFYFCSNACKDQFDAEPAKFAKTVIPK